MARPSTYTDADITRVQQMIDDYFITCEGKPLLDDEGKPVLNKYDEPIILGAKPPTVTGLCLALGFSKRDTLLDYESRNEQYPLLSDTITRAKLRCHQYAESRLYDKDGCNGAKFSLANNFGWVDRQEIFQHGDILLESAEDRRARIAAAQVKLIEGVKAMYQVLPDPDSPDPE